MCTCCGFYNRSRKRVNVSFSKTPHANFAAFKGMNESANLYSPRSHTSWYPPIYCHGYSLRYALVVVTIFHRSWGQNRMADSIAMFFIKLFPPSRLYLRGIWRRDTILHPEWRFLKGKNSTNARGATLYSQKCVFPKTAHECKTSFYKSAANRRVGRHSCVNGHLRRSCVLASFSTPCLVITPAASMHGTPNLLSSPAWEPKVRSVSVTALICECISWE